MYRYHTGYIQYEGYRYAMYQMAERFTYPKPKLGTGHEQYNFKSINIFFLLLCQRGCKNYGTTSL